MDNENDVVTSDDFAGAQEGTGRWLEHAQSPDPGGPRGGGWQWGEPRPVSCYYTGNHAGEPALLQTFTIGWVLWVPAWSQAFGPNPYCH